MFILEQHAFPGVFDLTERSKASRKAPALICGACIVWRLTLILETSYLHIGRVVTAMDENCDTAGAGFGTTALTTVSGTTNHVS